MPPITCDRGHQVDEVGTEPVAARKPCPVCGSTARRIERLAEERLTIHGALRTQLRRGGSSKVVQDGFVGSIQSADGTWVERSQVKDREADHYVEVITAADGSEIYRDEGPLSEHRGHGSDKPALRKARDDARRDKAATRCRSRRPC